MTESISDFGSINWIPDIHELCFEVLRNLQKRPGGRFLRFREEIIGTVDRPGIIITEYQKSLISLKKEIYNDFASTEHIDHHKIAALYIREFLIHQPFCLDIPPETKNNERCLNTVLANEYFIIAYLTIILKGWNQKLDKTLKMDNRYKFDFVKLLYRFKKDIKKLDVLALANIICLIEKHFFKEK